MGGMARNLHPLNPLGVAAAGSEGTVLTKRGIP
jgi:hypothetical protein